MKRVLLLTLVFSLSLSAYCQNKIEIIKDSFPTYQRIVSFENKSSKQLYSMVKEWVVINFKSGNDVIQLDDFDNGKLIVKGSDSFSYITNVKILGKTNTITTSVNVYFNITFDTKDNKYRYTLNYTEFEVGGIKSNDFTCWNAPQFKDYFVGFERSRKSLIDRISNIKSNKTDDNW